MSRLGYHDITTTVVVNRRVNSTAIAIMFLRNKTKHAVAFTCCENSGDTECNITATTSVIGAVYSRGIT